MWHCSSSYIRTTHSKMNTYLLYKYNTHTCTPLTHTFSSHLSFHSLYHFLVEEHMPAEIQLRHISIKREISLQTLTILLQRMSTPHHNRNSILGAGLPLVPTKLVCKIESGALIEMTNLLPKRLGTYNSNEEPNTRMKTPTATNSMKWL